MAKPKVSKKPAPSPKKPDSGKPAAEAEAYEPDKDRRALQQLVARHGGVDAGYRAAFDELIEDAGRAELGAKTRAAGVFREGVAWAVQIDQTFTKYPALVKEHYSPERFRYFLDRLGALDSALAVQRARHGDQGMTRSTAAERETAARKMRRRLIAKLRGFAGRRAAEGKAIEAALGTTENATALGGSIRSLVELARLWLAREGSVSEIQRASAGLTQSVVDAALSAAEELTGAAASAVLAGRRSSVDAPEVNLIEGSVLHEMEEVARCFDEAREATLVVPRLVPGAATRHVLGSKKPSKKAAPAPDPTEGGPG